jgi:hypothetical protein
MYNYADHGGRTFHGMKCLCPFKHWDRWFEPHSRYGSLSAFTLCLCCPVQVAALPEGLTTRLRWPTDCVHKVQISELNPNGRKREEEENIYYCTRHGMCVLSVRLVTYLNPEETHLGRFGIFLMEWD